VVLVVGAAVVLVEVVEVEVVVVGKATGIGSNPIILAAVDEELTAPINPGINPLADTNVITFPFIVLTTRVPGVPIYKPPYPLFSYANDEPDKGVTGSPPENCGFVTKPNWLVKLAIAIYFYF
jgi:hypothetical protein